MPWFLSSGFNPRSQRVRQVGEETYLMLGYDAIQLVSPPLGHCRGMPDTLSGQHVLYCPDWITKNYKYNGWFRGSIWRNQRMWTVFAIIFCRCCHVLYGRPATLAAGRRGVAADWLSECWSLWISGTSQGLHPASTRGGMPQTMGYLKSYVAATYSWFTTAGMIQSLSSRILTTYMVTRRIIWQLLQQYWLHFINRW